MRERGGLSPFAATRPLSNATFVGVKFRAAGLAALGAWAVVIVCLALWWTYTGRPPELRPAWDRAVTRFGAARASVGCALAAVAAVLLTWRALAVGLCSGLTGRHWVVPAQIILGFFVFLQGMYEWTMWDADPARRERALALAPWFAAALVAVKFALAAWIVAALRRRELIDRPTLAPPRLLVPGGARAHFPSGVARAW